MGAPPVDATASGAFPEPLTGMPGVFRNPAEKTRFVRRSKGKIASNTAGKQAQVGSGKRNRFDHLPKLISHPVAADKNQRMILPLLPVFMNSSDQNPVFEGFEETPGGIRFGKGVETEDAEPCAQFAQASVGGETKGAIPFQNGNTQTSGSVSTNAAAGVGGLSQYRSISSWNQFSPSETVTTNGSI